MSSELRGFDGGAARFRQILETCWHADTSAYDTFDPSRPSAGQCAVTALVVNDYYDGEFRRCLNMGDSHYWNVLPGDPVLGVAPAEVDFTRDQFPVWAPRELTTEPRSRLLSSPTTVERYLVLRARVINATRHDPRTSHFGLRLQQVGART